MCTLSMVGDHYRDMWQPMHWYPQQPQTITVTSPSEITRAEFEDLKRQVLEMKELLKRAKKYDEENGEAECETDEKMEVLRRVAKLVGVSLDDVLSKTEN